MWQFHLALLDNTAVRVPAVPAIVTISAPLDVTWVDGTNPPEFAMNIDWVAPGDVQVGDVPKIQFNGAGTIYEGDAVAVVGGPIIFPTMPTLDPDDYTAVVWFDRDEGGPGEVLGAHSDPSPQFTIEEDEEEISWATIFAGSENGWLHDPSDITKLFTDSGMTTPVASHDDPVGGIADSSGKNNHLTQTTSGLRPIYKTTGGRKAVASWDGGQYITSPANVDLSGGPIVTIVVALQENDAGTGVFLQINDGTDGLSSPTIEVLRLFAGAAPDIRASVYGNVGETRVQGSNTASTGSGERYYMRLRFDYSQPAATEVQVWINGVSFGSVTTSNENTNSNYGASRRIALLARGAGGLYANFTWYLLNFGINRDLTPDEITYVEAQAAARIA